MAHISPCGTIALHYVPTSECLLDLSLLPTALLSKACLPQLLPGKFLGATAAPLASLDH